MKKILVTAFVALMSYGLFGQVPQKMSYQAVVRDKANTLIANSTIEMRISIVKNSEYGTEIYVETQTPTSDENGLVSLEVGSGNVVSGDFSTIDWGNGTYFIKTEMDIDGGTDYTNTETHQLLSVPYALYAEKVGSGPQGPQGPSGTAPDGVESGEMLYWDGTDWVKIAPGQEGDILMFIGGKPVWQ